MTDLVTLITGASAGIGTELARVFASNGHRLALVDRRGDRLTMLASEIVSAGGTAPILIPCDLEHSNACDKIAAALAAEGVEVEFVVNNAGSVMQSNWTGQRTSASSIGHTGQIISSHGRPHRHGWQAHLD